MDRRIARFAVGFLFLAAGCGGQSHPAQPQSRPAIESPFRTPARMEAPVLNPSTMLTYGPPPLPYLFSAGGNIRILDAETNTVLFQGAVPAGTLISVTADRGIHVGDRRVRPGPLPADHTYQIWYDAR